MRAEIAGITQEGDTAWTEFHWWGTTEGGDPIEMRGVTQFEVHDGHITHGRHFVDQVELNGADINDAVEGMTGHRPELPPDA